ncbi:hypothetical protein FHW58_002853 [Duganella sp. 1224]|uniref:hypothetical protein n=1 Tax=Duganella sp. 1224 TaxID=2587052 RepID=UPI0015C7CAC0|nr:hypothetical protein [Duganella sp. 1224]NYE61646.1 hypothetical protein [Duganella sp. 1224]
MTKDQQRFDELCFLYACGKADPADAAWIERQLPAHPEWQAALSAERALVQAGRGALAARHAAQAPLLSDADFMALAERVDAERASAAPAPAPEPVPSTATAAAAATPQRRPPSAAYRLLAALCAWWQRPMQAGYGYVAMALLVLSISAHTWRLTQPAPDAAPYRGVALANTASAQLRVQFDDSISAGQLRATLATLGLTIVHGPDHSGAYLLSASGSAAVAAQQLQVTRVALDVQLLTPANQGNPP